MRDLELWGGHECTVNRVGDAVFDQTRLSGHHARLSDLERFAALGFKALRYPVLWERVAPDDPDVQDWTWSDERLARLAELEIRPVVGLVHHGSGPRYTSLLDDGFAPGLAAFAAAAARRYPHVRDWTPVNEPLTTARFSALYGHWSPHATDERSFWLALLNQIDGVRLAMAEIRRVVPEARLIQTEDLGRTFATPDLADQAAFDNRRRWMTWDLLDGAVTPGHAFWDRLVGFGFEARLRRIADAPCPADVIGVNHYVTSDRFLDGRIERYPAAARGGNGRQRFADVEAVRVVDPPTGGLAAALEDAAARYGRALAVTESHLACTREEQGRWTLEAWRTALDLRARGVPIEAVTAWALLGSFDWNCLLTRSDGCYESGAFDVRGPAPRPTAIAGVLRAISAGESGFHPAFDGPGWWRRPLRLAYPSSPAGAPTRPPPSGAPGRGRPLLITGATGTLGQAFARACRLRGLDAVLTDRRRLSLDSLDSIEAALDATGPWAVINTAGWVRVDDAEREPEACLAANADGAARLAQACARRGLPFVGFSSDLVFDGLADVAYDEDAAPAPINVYGRSKVLAESAVAGLPGALMIRTAAFFSPDDPHNFAHHVVRVLEDGHAFAAAADLVISPTYVPDLVQATLDLLIDGETGLWHLANDGAMSWADFARAIAEAAGLDPAGVRPASWRTFGWAAPRPARVPLISRRGPVMPRLDDAVRRFGEIHRGRRQAKAVETRPEEMFS